MSQTAQQRSAVAYAKWYAPEPGEVSGAKFAGRRSEALRSMGEVARILGVSRQSVHQVERRALTKIRAAMRQAGYSSGRPTT